MCRIYHNEKDINHEFRHRGSALQIACACQSMKMIEYLLGCFDNIDLLMESKLWNTNTSENKFNSNMIGMDVVSNHDPRNRARSTNANVGGYRVAPILIGINLDNEKIVEMLLSHKNMNIKKDVNALHCLRYSIRNNAEKCSLLLIKNVKNGVDVNAICNRFTPLQLACQYRQESIVQRSGNSSRDFREMKESKQQDSLGLPIPEAQRDDEQKKRKRQSIEMIVTFDEENGSQHAGQSSETSKSRSITPIEQPESDKEPIEIEASKEKSKTPELQVNLQIGTESEPPTILDKEQEEKVRSGSEPTMMIENVERKDKEEDGSDTTREGGV